MECPQISAALEKLGQVLAGRRSSDRASAGNRDNHHLPGLALLI